MSKLKSKTRLSKISKDQEREEALKNIRKIIKNNIENKK